MPTPIRSGRVPRPGEDGVHFRTCNLCEAMCGLAIEVKAGRVAAIRGDEADPFSKGHLCPKATALADLQDDPDRLRAPMVREGARWREIGWDEALDRAAKGLARVQVEHGRDSVAAYLGNPTVHNHGALLFAPPFLRSLGTRQRYSATSVDQLPQMLAALLLYGHQLLVPVPDIDRTHHMLIFGANPAVSNGSLMTAPDARRRLAAIRARGGRVVLLDPRRTETAKMADEHHFLRPGTDALALLALVHVLFEEGRVDPGRLGPHLDGIEDVRRAVAAFPPERVAEATGLPADVLRRIAREFAAAPSAVAYGRVGISTQPFGGLASWLVNVLNVLTGNLDRAGGAMFTRPAFDVVALTARMGQNGSFGRRATRVRGLPEFGGEFPAAAMAEEMDTPGEGQVRALVTFAGNPVLSTPNGARLDRALASLDFMVSIDAYLNETTRHAHLILPPATALERSHYDLAFHLLAVRNTAKHGSPVLLAPASARHDWQILHELAGRLDRLKRRGLKARVAHAARGRLGPEGILAVGLRLGPQKVTLARLRKNDHGIDLGALEPCLPGRLRTPEKRIALAPEPFLRDLARVKRFIEAPPEPLVLIGRRQLRSNNSWMHNAPRLTKGEATCTLLMHPSDADRLKLVDGALVRLASRAGAVEVPIEVSDEIMPGVVSLPHGWGHGRPGTRLAVANARGGASINDVTEDSRVDELTGNAAFSATPVAVEAVAR